MNYFLIGVVSKPPEISVRQCSMTFLDLIGSDPQGLVALVHPLPASGWPPSHQGRSGVCCIHQQDMNSKIIITLFSLFSELEKDLISLRTKEALSAKKAQGQLRGKPKGTLQKSKFDRNR
jgi:Resolvase, N terminal domain